MSNGHSTRAKTKGGASQAPGSYSHPAGGMFAPPPSTDGSSQQGAFSFNSADLDELFGDDYGYDGGATVGMGEGEGMGVVGLPLARPATATELRKRKSAAPPPGSLPPPPKISSSGDGEVLTEAQKLERRERNREHAKRSRLRKKFLLESLQDQINGLQEENEKLKGIIQKELPNKAATLLAGTTEEGQKAEGEFKPAPMPSGFGPVRTLLAPDFRLMSALSGSQQNFTISDPSIPDNPIVYVSQGFLDLTGYTLDQVLGRNCRFLQGPGTDQSAVDTIRQAVAEGVDTSVCLLNYKADGTPFWNQFFVAGLRDSEGNVVNYVGVQCEVSKATVESQRDATAEK